MEYNIEEILEMYEDDFNPGPRPMAQEPRNMAEGGRMLNPVQMGEDLGYRTGFRKPIYVPTKKSYVVKDRKNNLIEDFKIEDYGSKSKAKKAADALDKKISAENEKRRIETSKKNRADFSNKRIDFKKSINTWTQNWMDNNIGKYDLQDADTFIKDMKEAFEDFNIEAPTKNTAASIDGFPNIGTDAKGGKAAFTPYGIDSIKKPGKSKGGSSYYDSFFRRAFLTNKIQTDDVLKNRISNYLDYATLNKPGGGPALDKLKLKYADTLNNLDDVMYVLSDDTQVVNLAKKNMLSNIFPQYNKFKAKQNSSMISRKNNIAKIEKTLGPKKLKELLNGGTSINKFLVDEGKTLKEFFPSMKELPKGLRYSVDHNIGIAEIAKLSKSDMEKALSSLIGMSNKRNYDLGWKGYSVIKKNLISKIQQGVNVSDNLNKLNEITAKAYPEELKGKKAYDLVNDKLTFTEDFTFRTNPEERFKSYFREINKTPEGGAAIKKDFGSMNNLTKKVMAFCPAGTAKVTKAGGGRVPYADGPVCTPEEAVRGLNEEIDKIKKGNASAGESSRTVNKLKNLGSVGMRGLVKAGLVSEVLFEAALGFDKVVSEGQSPMQAFRQSYLTAPLRGLGVMKSFEEGEKEEILAAAGDKGKVGRVLDLQKLVGDKNKLANKIESLKSNLTKVKSIDGNSFMADDGNNFMAEKNISDAKAELQDMRRSGELTRAEQLFSTKPQDLKIEDQSLMDAYNNAIEKRKNIAAEKGLIAQSKAADRNRLRDRMKAEGILTTQDAKNELQNIGNYYGRGFTPYGINKLYEYAGMQNPGFGIEKVGPRTGKYNEEKGLQEYLDSMRTQQIADAGGVANMANGGIANLMKKYYD